MAQVKFSIGAEVVVGNKYQGFVRFFGETKFAPGVWVGVELAEPQGKNDGTVRDVKYFKCSPNHGLFVRTDVVKLLTEDPPLPGQTERRFSKEEADDDEEDDRSEQMPKFSRASQTRRMGVSAEAARRATADLQADVWTPPVHEKTPKERGQLAEIIRTSHDSKMGMLFGNISVKVFQQVLDAMFAKQVAKGEHVIEQGDEGNFFYIGKSGTFSVLVKKDGAESKVYEAGAGFAFGELALLYNAPRSATVVADEACEDHIASLAEVLGEEDFDEDEAILEQGEKDNKMYILRSGEAVACIQGDQGEVPVMRYKQGDYFGEIALLTGEPRKASVYAVGPVTCMYLTRDTFARLLGPLRDFLQKNIGNYQQYQDAIQDGAGEAAEQDPLSQSNAFADGQSRERRKRRRDSKVIGEVGTAGQAAESHAKDDSKDEPSNLADKVAQDFKNPALVSPANKFDLSDQQLRVYGGLRLGEKFTVDKTLIMMSKASRASDGTDDLLTWNGPNWLKGSTHAAVTCQKGQKSASDPTPNQDNYFMVHIGNVGIFGVCDGHGPFGHLVSFRLVQSLPFFIASNSNYGKDWALTLKEAFLSAQSDLVRFCGEHQINIDASGAAGTVVVFDGTCFHFAHIGDAGAMLASYNRRDSCLIHGTTDHKPELPEEKARLEAAGNDVRRVDPESWRVYLKGSNFPGLTMSRAFGDTACEGVLREPEYKQIFVQPADEVYLVVASDGIWEFIEKENAVDLSAKKLRLKGPKETVNFLTSAGRKRWAHVCGDYCDDITCMLVQFNVNEKTADSSSTNQSLAVRRHE